MNKSPLVSIIIVNFNGRKYLDQCFASLKRQTYSNFETILVDNASADDSIKFIEENYSGFVKVIRNSDNFGFAKGNNIGIQTAGGKYIATLNNDTIVNPRWLEELIKAAECDEKIGMCASKIYLAESPDLIDSVGMLIYSDGICKQRGWREKDKGQYETKEEVLLPSACAALYRKKMLDKIGLFDEDFFAYCEDVDLGLRGRLNGWRCIFVPKAIVCHFYSGLWKNYPFKKIFYLERNRLLLVFKIFPFCMILKSFYYYILRNIYYMWSLILNRGIVKEYMKGGSLSSLILVVFRAHMDAIKLLPAVFQKRKKIKRNFKQKDFETLFNQYGISAKELALKE